MRAGRWRTGRTWARRRSRRTCRSRATSCGAAIEEAHKRGLKVTGHLCSVTYAEAADLGIDNLEHGFFAVHRLRARTSSPTCVPGRRRGQQTIAALDENGAPFKALVKKLVDKKVALTSTLTVFETFTPGRPMPPGLDVLLPQLKEQFEQNYAARPRRTSSRSTRRSSRRDGARARVRARGRDAHRRHRSDRRRRRDSRLLESAAARAARRGGLHAARGDPHRHAERREVPRPRRARRLDRRRQAGGPRRHRRRPVDEHRRHPQGRDRVQAGRRLRSRPS